MTTTTVPPATFRDFRGLLLDLGFTMDTAADRIRFEHSASGTRFLYPPYADEEPVYAGDLAAARHVLDYKDFLTRGQFEERLRPRAAG